MSATIIVPLDTTENSVASLPLARELAQRIEGRISLLSVVEIPGISSAWLESGVIDKRPDHQVEVNDYLDGIARQISDIAVTTQTWMGSPCAGIVDAARRAENPVIVMASHARTRIPRARSGSVAFRVLHDAPCPVILTRPSEESVDPIVGDLSRLLVALDGSAFAEEALSAAQAVLGTSGLRLHLVRVIETTKWNGWTYATLSHPALEYCIQSLREEAADYLRCIATDLESTGHSVTWEVRAGIVAVQLDDVARAHEVGMIVMATHGRTGCGRKFIGSVAESVLYTAPVPVLMVHPSRA